MLSLFGRKRPALPKLAEFVCTCCGEPIEGWPALHLSAPTSDDPDVSTVRETSDVCVWSDGNAFVRCVLSLPVQGVDDRTLEFGVWASLSAANFERYEATFDGDRQGELGPMFGWFSSRVPGYPSTLSLKCRVHPQNDRKRPFIELEASDHPLSLDQRHGVTVAFAEAYLREHLRGTIH